MLRCDSYLYMKILFAASEMTPYAKTGGLGDVVGALPGALRRLGHEVTCCLPYYRCVRLRLEEMATAGQVRERSGGPVAAGRPLLRGRTDSGGDAAPTRKEKPVGPIKIPLGEKVVTGDVLEWKQADGVRMLFVRCDQFYDRPELYQDGDEDYEDNAERFLFFSKAVAQLAVDPRFRPDVVHCHDWQTALVPAFVKTAAGKPAAFGNQLEKAATSRSTPKTVFTIHNIAFQGIFPAKAFALTNLSKEFFTPAALEFYGRLNPMKGGILFADALTTVSRTYAKEIQTPAGGFGLDGVLQMRARELHGILNGVDYAHWNPATNGCLKQRYSPDDLSGKQACKTDLLERMGLEGEPTPDPSVGGERKDRGAVGHRALPTADGARTGETPVPLLGFVSRLTEQKGVEVLADAIEDLVGAGAVLAILGKGERKYEEMLLAAARRFPGQVAVKIAHDEELAHRIQAGADMLLVPSRFEPCGLTQLYALKYGTIPVVRATGGLEDTVVQYDERSRLPQGTGFKFALYKSEALVEAVRRAILLYNQPEKWQKLMRTAMACDFSWQASAKEYEELYAAL